MSRRVASERAPPTRPHRLPQREGRNVLRPPHGTPQIFPHRNLIRATTMKRGIPQWRFSRRGRGEAESAERKIETTTGNERAGDISKRILSPWTSRLDCLSTSAGRSSPINPMNLCALCLSAPLRESKTTTTRETPGSGAAADASSIWYNVDGSSEQPSTAEQSGWRP